MKGAVVPAVVRGAAHVLVVGTLARESMLARGADPARIDVFADTIDVAAFGEHADALASQRDELRREAGVGPDDVAALAVHLMTNTALTGATYDIDGGQQLL